MSWLESGGHVIIHVCCESVMHVSLKSRSRHFFMQNRFLVQTTSTIFWVYKFDNVNTFLAVFFFSSFLINLIVAPRWASRFVFIFVSSHCYIGLIADGDCYREMITAQICGAHTSSYILFRRNRKPTGRFLCLLSLFIRAFLCLKIRTQSNVRSARDVEQHI